MAYITLDPKKLKYNYDYLCRLFQEKEIKWAVVSKLLCGNALFLEELFRLEVKQLCDSRLGNLKAIKKISPETETVYIKPPPPRSVPDIIRYADISFNTEYRTLELLSAEAGNQGIVHKVMIMIELGELREGVMRSDVVTFYEKAFMLPNIRVIGIGTNFTCLSGVLPNHDKLNQLVLYRELLETKFKKQLPWISGGASVSIPLIFTNQLPEEINHFRVGETLFFGTDVYHNTPLPDMQQGVITLYAEIIELIEKPLVPDGELGNNLEGHVPEFDQENCGKTSWRAIVDIGLLDVESSHLTPVDPTIECAGASSDMLVVNLGSDMCKYETGDYIEFKTDYMGTLRLMNSRYIEKRVKQS